MKLFSVVRGVLGAIAWALLTVGAFDLLNIYHVPALIALVITHLVFGLGFVFFMHKGQASEAKIWGKVLLTLIYVGLLGAIQTLFYQLILIDFNRFPWRWYWMILLAVAVVLVVGTLLMRKVKPGRFKVALWSSLAALVASIPLLLLTTLFNVNILSYRAPIAFSSGTSIDLQMFKGWNRPGGNLDGSSRFAFITSTIEYEMHKDGVEVEAYFHPSRSYVYNKNLIDRFLLKHEIYHFHIAEYWARTFRKRISEFDSKPSRQMLKLDFESIQENEYRMQVQYDRETAHGYILGRQKDWIDKIDSLLTQLDDFASPLVSFE